MKKALAVAAAGAFLALGVAPAANAGEITGNGRPTPIKTGGVAASPCAFSGLEDFDASGSTATPRATQNWGQIARHAKGQLGGMSPATTGCNPNVPPPPEG